MKPYKKLMDKINSEGVEEKEEVRADYGVDPSVIAHLIGLVFWSRDQTHYWHLQTDSEAIHTTLGGYYDGLLGLGDSLAEVLIGKLMARPTNKIVMQALLPLAEGSMIQDHLDTVNMQVAKYYSKFDDCESVKNILAEMQALILKTKFLLTLK